MGDNEGNVSQEIGDVGSKMVQEAMSALHPDADQPKAEVQKEEAVTEEAKETPSTETKPDDKAVAEGNETGKATEEKSKEVATETKKLPYTPAEISRILETGEKADTSRMSAETQVFYREMQKGLTRKFQADADERKRRLDEITRREKALRDKEIEDEEKKLRAEEELLDPEHAKDRQEKRKIFREKDELKAEVAEIKRQLEEEGRRKIAEQNDREFYSVKKEINFPDDPDFAPKLEDAAYSYMWAQNVGALQAGQPTMSIADGAKSFADLIGLTNPGNLRKIVNANPKFKEAYDKEVIENYLKKKNAGPTTIKSSAAGVKEKVESDEKFDKKLLDDPSVNYEKRMLEEALKELKKIKN